MPAGFSRADVEKIARLAHLELSAAELDMFTRQLGDILEYANQVQQIDTTGVPPTASVLMGTSSDDAAGADRPDVVRRSLDRSDAIANAPDGAPDRGFFRVPRVIG